MVRLGEICTIQSGGTPSRSNFDYWKNGTISWVKISDIKDKYLNFTEEHITSEGLKNSSAKIFSKGTILYTIFATLGEVSVLNIEAATNQAIAGIKLINDDVYNDFLYYYLVSKKEEVNNIGRGVAQNNINLSILKNFEIRIPELQEQRKIVNNLNVINKIINKRKQQLKKLDELVKSRFIEMFGDPVLNPLKWKEDFLGNYINVLTDFSANGSYELLDSHVVMYDKPQYAIMVRTVDLESGDLQNGVKYIDKTAYELLSKSKLYGGELIMNKIGSAGKIYIMPEIKVPASLGRNAFMFRFDERLNMTFLYLLLTSKYGTLEIQKHVRGTVTKTITKNDARQIRIIVPPIDLQNEFAAIVKQTDKSKLEIQKSLDKLEILKKSLMQQYFG